MNLEKEISSALSILEIDKEISASNIKKAYRKTAKKYHPDLFLSKPKEAKIAEQKMKKINEAKDLLDNFIDVYGIDELINLYSKIVDVDIPINNESNLVYYAKDSELFINEKTSIEQIEKNASRIYKIIVSSVEHQRSKQQHFIYVLENAIRKLNVYGQIVIADKVTYYKGNSCTHEPLGRWYSTDRDYISHYRNLNLVNALEQLNVKEGDTTSVDIEIGKTGKKEIYFLSKEGHRLCLLEKCDSYIEYLLKNEVVTFSKAQVHRGKSKSYYRRNGEERIYVEDSIIEYFFVPNKMEWNISELEEIKAGTELQISKFSSLHNKEAHPTYPAKQFRNIIEHIDSIFLHHREVVPNTKRLGMMYFSFNDRSLIYTPAELQSDFLIDNNISVGTYKELFDMMILLSTVANKLTSDIVKQYILNHGKCHYHIGNEIVSIMTFHKSATDTYSGLHIRFYLKTNNICLYDLPVTNEKNDDLTSLKNLGQGMVAKLKAIGINNSVELFQYSTEDIIGKLISAKLPVDYITLYSIEGAKSNLKISKLSTERKKELRLFYESIL